jgi:hypothetical protein
MASGTLSREYPAGLGKNANVPTNVLDQTTGQSGEAIHSGDSRSTSKSSACRIVNPDYAKIIALHRQVESAVVSSRVGDPGQACWPES